MNSSYNVLVFSSSVVTIILTRKSHYLVDHGLDILVVGEIKKT